MAVEFRDVVKKYAGTDEALGVPAGTVGGIPVPSPEDFATAEQGAKADTAVQPDDLGTAATMSPVEVVTDPDAQAALSGAFGRSALNMCRDLWGQRARPGVVSDCEVGDAWVNGAEDATHVIFGSTSIKGESVNNARLRLSLFTADWQAPFDLTRDDFLVVWIYVEDPSKIQNLYIHLFNASGGTLTRHLTENRVRAGWNAVHFGPNMSWLLFEGGATSINEFQPESLERLQVRLESKPTETATIWLGAVHSYARVRLPGGLVTLMFDDGNASDATIVKPLLDEHGLRAMSFVNTDTIGTGGKMTVDQLHSLQSAGWDVCSHSDDHTNLTQVSLEEADTKLAAAHEWLVAQDLHRGARFLAFPHNAYTPALLDVARRYYAGIRGGDLSHGQTQYLPTFDYAGLSSRPTDTGASVAQIKGWIDSAKTEGSWLSIYSHGITSGGTATDPTTQAGLAEIVEYLAASGVTVATYSDLQIKYPAP